MCLAAIWKCLRGVARLGQKQTYVRVGASAFNSSTYNSSISLQEVHDRDVKTLMSQVNVSRRMSRVSSERSSLDSKLNKKVSLPADPAHYRVLMERHQAFDSADLTVQEYQDVGGVLILNVPLRSEEKEQEVARQQRRHSV